MNSDDLYIVYNNIFCFVYDDNIDLGLLVFYTHDKTFHDNVILTHLCSMINYIIKVIDEFI